MQENIVTAFEVIENQIALSAVVADKYQALNVDTSNIVAGMQLTLTENFIVNGDIITVAGITINTNEVEITTAEERLEKLKQ